MNGTRYFLWLASRGLAPIPFFAEEIRRLIWDACFPIVWMRCSQCTVVLLLRDRCMRLSIGPAIDRYYILNGDGVCNGCVDAYRRQRCRHVACMIS